MNYPLATILHASSSVQIALLRYTSKEGQQSLHARIVFDGENLIHCIIEGRKPQGLKIGDDIHLVQKKCHNYFFISGQVTEKAKSPAGVLSVSVSRAFWFERKSRGNVAWLREKYRYEDVKMPFAS